MVLLDEQKEFIEAVYDNLKPDGRLLTRRAVLSIARKNGKTGLIAALLEAHLIGPEAKPNSQIYSAARSRDQAALVFNYAAKSLRMNPKLQNLVQITDSGKKIVGLAKGVTYKAMSADATTAHGLSPALTIHDELGQVVGPNDKLFDAFETAGGAQLEPLSLIISTQAANDTDLLSTIIDDGLRNPDKRETVIKLYAAAKDEDIFDEELWYRVNFALGKFRDYDEFKEMAERARRMPSTENTFRNLYLNMRISLLSLAFSPTIWKNNATNSVEYDLFTSGLPVHIALDLSQKVDLTAAVATVQNPDTGVVSVMTWVFTPYEGLTERAMVDRAPYTEWARDGYLIPIPGKVVDYEMVVEFLSTETKKMNVVSVNFDRWRIELLKKEAVKIGLWTDESIIWNPVGQGFKDMSPRIESVEVLLMNNKLAHGAHPLLEMGAANAIAIYDPAKNRKLEKAKSSARIDPIVAMVMGVHAAVAPDEDAEVVHGDQDFFIA